MKIIVLGDSTGMPRVYGKELPRHPEIEIRYDECFPERLRRLMKEEFSEDVIVRDLCARYYLSKQLCDHGYGEAHLFEPDYVIIAVGMVDCWNRNGINWAPYPDLVGKSPWINQSEFSFYIRTFVNQCFKTIKTLKGIVLRGIVCCSRDRYNKHVGCEQKSIEYNAIMQEVAKMHNVYYLDVFSPFANTPALLASDGTHPSNLGHKVMAEKMFYLLKNIHKSNTGDLSLKKALKNFQEWEEAKIPGKNKKGEISVKNLTCNKINPDIQKKCNKLLITGERCSGTTFLASLLNAQNRITICRDYLHLHRMMQSIGISSVKSTLSGEQNKALKEQFVAWNNLRGGIDVALPDAGFDNLLDFYNYALGAISQPNDILCGHKSTMAHGIIGELLSSISDLKVIYVLRDPRDVVASAYSIWPKGRETVFDFADQWRVAAKTIMQYQKEEAFVNKLMVVYFEELMAEPEKILCDIAVFLGIDSINLPDSYVDMEEKWHGNVLPANIVDPFKSNVSGMWKYSNSLLGKIVQAMLYREMWQLGYESSEEISDQEKTLICTLRASVTSHRDRSTSQH